MSGNRRAAHRVLEIGTGTGYNVALLAHRLGEDNITTVEVDPVMTARARQALAAIGYRPWVICADGTDGVAAHAPYDRVIATVALPYVPPADPHPTELRRARWADGVAVPRLDRLGQRTVPVPVRRVHGGP